MNRESQARFVAVLLFLLTVAAVVFAGFNLQKEREYAGPDDGVWWVEQDGRLVADRVDPNGPGAKAGIKPGDQLVSVNSQDVRNTPDLERQLYSTGVWHNATYSLIRQSVALDSKVMLIPADHSLNNSLRLIALIYLGIGIYVLLRRWTAPGSTHFYIFCLVSFIAYSFKYTGKLNDFDWIIYWSNIVAWVLQPALFLHFVSIFPEKREFVRRHAVVAGVGLLARSGAAGTPHCGPATGAGQRPTALGHGPAGNGLWRGSVRGGGRGAVVQLPSGQHDDSAPAVEVGHARHHSGHRSLHAVLCAPFPDGLSARHLDETVGAVAGPVAADVRLRHLPLSLDGR